MEQRDFKSSLVNRAKNENREPASWLKIQRIWYALGKNKLQYTKSLGGDEDNRDTLCFLRRESAHSNASSWDFPQLNNEELPVSKKKLKDLLDLMLYKSENPKNITKI